MGAQMKKIPLKTVIILSLLLAFCTFVKADATLNVVEDTVSIILPQGTTQTAEITVENTGATPINLDVSHDIDLTDRDGNTITLSFSDPGSIAPGSSAKVTITATANENQNLETYSGTVTVKDKNSNAQDTFSLSMKVELDACVNGQAGKDLVLDIKDPDNDKKFKPGDDIPISVKVKNVGTSDHLVKVKAFLVSDRGTVIEDASSKVMNIDNGDDETFDFSIQMPTDSKKIRDNNEQFTLVIKAFDDDNEEQECIQDQVTIKLKLDRINVIIEDATILPQSVTCGDSGLVTVDLANIGKDAAEGFVSIENRELNIFQKSENARLDKFTASERNRAKEQFSIFIPKDAKLKEYSLTIKSSFDTSQDASIVRFEVNSCNEVAPEVMTPKPVIITPTLPEIESAQGSFIFIPVQITNNQEKKTLYFVSLANAGDIGQSTTTKSLFLNPDQTATVFLDLTINDAVVEGKYTPTIEVRDEHTLLSSEPIVVSIKEKENESYSPELPLAVWLVLDLIVFCLIVVGIKVITKRK